jgi:hypothetical protein
MLSEAARIAVSWQAYALHTNGQRRLGVTQPLTMVYTDFGMFSDALSAHQFALARVLAALSCVPAPLSGGAAFPSASQSLR